MVLWRILEALLLVSILRFHMAAADDVINLYPPEHDLCVEDKVVRFESDGNNDVDRKITKTIKGNGCTPFIKCWHTFAAPACYEEYVTFAVDRSKFDHMIISDRFDKGPWVHSHDFAKEMKLVVGICKNTSKMSGFSCYFICRIVN